MQADLNGRQGQNDNLRVENHHETRDTEQHECRPATPVAFGCQIGYRHGIHFRPS